ncbi:MAG: OmpH family outer membrane protein [Deltaproteobacteria bacterium]|nr:OmpH family outer membrane protein [Deltaproteobacteria bacterium]
MIKKLIPMGLLLMVVMCLPIHKAFAQEKIALVSLQRALNEVEEGKKIKETLKTEYETKKKKIDAMKLELETLSKDLDKQQMVLSGEALQTKRKVLQEKFIDLQNKAALFEKELKTKESENAQRILTTLRDIVIKISTGEGYTLVIENSTETVLFSKNAQDITPQVIAAYNKK